jgi:hypothetical protein
VGGSPAAASLIAALAVGAGSLGGSREILLAMEAWSECGTDLEAWNRRLTRPVSEPMSVWPEADHPPGFDPHGIGTSTPVKQLLKHLARALGGTGTVQTAGSGPTCKRWKLWRAGHCPYPAPPRRVSPIWDSRPRKAKCST